MVYRVVAVDGAGQDAHLVIRESLASAITAAEAHVDSAAVLWVREPIGDVVASGYFLGGPRQLLSPDGLDIAVESRAQLTLISAFRIYQEPTS